MQPDSLDFVSSSCPPDIERANDSLMLNVGVCDYKTPQYIQSSPPSLHHGSHRTNHVKLFELALKCFAGIPKNKIFGKIMKTLTNKIYFLLVLFTFSNAHGNEIKVTNESLYFSDQAGHRKLLEKHSRIYKYTLSQDKKYVAWQRTGEDDRINIFNIQKISIQCNPLIRDFYFYQNKYIVLNCGGLHFAGTLYLYDPNTGKQISHIDEAAEDAKKPDWAKFTE